MYDTHQPHTCAEAVAVVVVVEWQWPCTSTTQTVASHRSSDVVAQPFKSPVARQLIATALLFSSMLPCLMLKSTHADTIIAIYCLNAEPFVFGLNSFDYLCLFMEYSLLTATFGVQCLTVCGNRWLDSPASICCTSCWQANNFVAATSELSG